eukprot:sb/3462048/
MRGKNPFLEDEAEGSGSSDNASVTELTVEDMDFIDDSEIITDHSMYLNMPDISLSSNTSDSGSDSERKRIATIRQRVKRIRDKIADPMSDEQRSKRQKRSIYMREYRAKKRDAAGTNAAADKAKERLAKKAEAMRKSRAKRRAVVKELTDVTASTTNVGDDSETPSKRHAVRLPVGQLIAINALPTSSTPVVSRSASQGLDNLMPTTPALPRVAVSRVATAVIEEFKDAMSSIPDCTCNYCRKLCYRQGVTKILGTGTEWICNRCKIYKKKGKFSPVDEVNMMLNPGSLPSAIEPNPTEVRMVSRRIPFMKIRSLPAGGQRGLVGGVVNCPISVQDTCLILPRANNNLGIVNVRIKRNVQHRSVILQDTVNPILVFKLLQYFQCNNSLYKDTVLSNTWVSENYHDNQDLFHASMFENSVVICRSILEEVVCSIGAEGTYDALPYESCIQDEDPAQSMTDAVFNKTPIVDFAPGQKETPLSLLGDEDMEPLAFPHHFPLGKGHFNDEARKLAIKSKILPKLSLKDYVESRLLHENRRFAQDAEYVFTMQAMVERTSIYLAIATHIRKSTKFGTSGDELRAGMLATLSDSDLKNEINALKFMKNIKASPAYWQRVKSDALAMAGQLGTFTWFLTFSFNDLVYSIPAILRLQGIVVTDDLLNNMSWFEKHSTLKTDPVIAGRTFDRYVHKILSILLHKGKLLGAVEAYFGRVEFGDRGSPHFHMMLKCSDAPQLGRDSLQDVLGYIDRFVTTENPSAETNPILHELVKLQTHRHTKTCTKYSSENDPNSCRFHFPRPVSTETESIGTSTGEQLDKTKVRTADRNKGRKQKVVYKCAPGDEFVNPYNRWS